MFFSLLDVPPCVQAKREARLLARATAMHEELQEVCHGTTKKGAPVLCTAIASQPSDSALLRRMLIGVSLSLC